MTFSITKDSGHWLVKAGDNAEYFSSKGQALDWAFEIVGKGYEIEVSVRDARRAYDILNDDSFFEFSQPASNVFKFDSLDQYNEAMMSLLDVEIIGN